MPIIIRYVLENIVLYKGHLDTLCVLCKLPEATIMLIKCVWSLSKGTAQMPDQSIYGDRGVWMSINRYFILRRMVIFGTFWVHIGKTCMNPNFFGFY